MLLTQVEGASLMCMY